ncbi:ribonucleoside-diphosphate reductase subunit alpha [Thermaerobacter sp. PB12/4term]|uniref:ribonucleoside-diphosphate reductase subunit alpha n=1 Tax=Thermaerobacter sp. PB12/4term TaxID=2293838 RepID=UPI000E32B545|nr:ribonucleoside-diphosphate reductase subunit alpha [Thermaerobacter sp. PB12/4term]QIA27785.1 ribonucleoside-diphosphate reductase subunit alpha [Thermaerobacter sp. PB12/4term]
MDAILRELTAGLPDADRLQHVLRQDLSWIVPPAGPSAPPAGNGAAAALADAAADAAGAPDAAASAGAAGAASATGAAGTGDFLEELLVQAATQNLHRDPEFERVAVRARLRQLYRQVLGEPVPGPERYRAAFPAYIRRGVACGALDERLLAFDLDELAGALRPERDESLPFIGLVTLADRYLVREPESRRLLETPQFLFMRVAMGLALAEEPGQREAWARRFYHAMSTFRYLPSTPTLFNAGTPHHQLSSCYLADVHDSMDHILEAARDFGLLAKFAGGIGASVTRLRAAGSPVRGINGESSGVIPFVHFYDALIKAVNQGGRRRGTLAVYLEPWHLEIEAFLDLKRNAGDPYLRAHSVNTALWIPDEFLRRVEAGEPWYLFDPAYVPELPERFGAAFRDAYAARVRQAEAGELPARAWKRVEARGLFREILATLQETSHPWLVFKDAGNARSLLPGVIHSSNLCTEIFLPTTADEVAVCNLASVNLARHVGPAGIDWEALAATVAVAMRGLDNVIDLNLYPIEKARRSNLRHRPVGLGVMGFAEAVNRLGLGYADPETAELADRVLEFISYHAILASHRLAEERGSFPAFAESGWARGKVPLDTLADLEEERGRPVTVDRSARLDWEGVRARVRQGMRNGAVLAVAPTATISLIAGTTPSLDPPYSNVFSRQTLSGKFLEVNRVLVEELRQRGLWEAVRDRIVEERGDLQAIAELPADLRRRYPTAYQVPPEAYLEIAARAQKWVDMGISRNLFLADRDLEAMERVYREAWRRGLKSTYYLFMAPRMYAEPSTVRVNKARRKLRWNLDEPAPAASTGGPRPSGAVPTAGAWEAGSQHARAVRNGAVELPALVSPEGEGGAPSGTVQPGVLQPPEGVNQEGPATPAGARGDGDRAGLPTGSGGARFGTSEAPAACRVRPDDPDLICEACQ